MMQYNYDRVCERHNMDKLTPSPVPSLDDGGAAGAAAASNKKRSK
jgi:hypothetical protein